MNRENAEKLSKEIGIDTTGIVREEYEMIILDELMNSPLGDDLIFKGGTALRLAYDSPRFSEDLDFSTFKSFSCSKTKALYQNITKKFPYLSLVDFRDKHFTCFALFKITEPFLPQAFSVKVEISKRKVNWKEKTDYQKIVLHSSVTPLKIFSLVVTKKHILNDKKKLIIERKKARDLFDCWYLSQVLKTKIDLKKTKMSSREVKSELNKFLPVKYRKVYQELTK